MTERPYPAAIVCLLILLLAVPSGLHAENHTATDGEAGNNFSLYLVRHAEKTAGGFDPDLTGYGRARAEFMAEWYALQGIEAVWSSDFKRTRNTAQPVADRLGVEVRIYDPRNQAALAEELLLSGVSALVVGHSNTIPDLAALLCRCEVAPMPDTEYERSFAVTVTGGNTLIVEPDLGELWTDRPVPDN